MAAKNRALFIDLLKGLALVVMIEVHVFNSLLLPEIKQAWWFNYLHFINGLVAPAFTFTSFKMICYKILIIFSRNFWRASGC